MSLISHLQLQSQLLQLHTFVAQFDRIQDTVSLCFHLYHGQRLIHEFLQQVRLIHRSLTTNNPFGKQLPVVLVRNIYTYLIPVRDLIPGHLVCKHWREALTSIPLRALFPRSYLPYQLLLPLAQKGHSWAQAKLAECYQRGIGGVQEDPKEAFKWAKLSSDQFDPEGFAALGYSYLCDQEEPNDAAGLLALRFSARAGSVRGYLELGACYLRGDVSGLKKDAKEALRLIQLSFGYGGASEYWLADRYIQEESPDYKEAFRLYLAAAIQGYPPAQFEVGMCYLRGIGVTEELKKSFRWLKVAAASGIDVAKRLTESGD